MDRFGIGQVRLPEFHIDNFRLPVFGNSSGTSGNHEIGLHESLVDAWYFSGYSNENPPEELVGVVGVNGYAMRLYNFAFTLGTGFGMYYYNFRNGIVQSSVSTTPYTLKYSGDGYKNLWFMRRNGSLGNPLNYEYGAFKFKVTGLKDGASIRISKTENNGFAPQTDYLTDKIYEDGVYTVPGGRDSVSPAGSNYYAYVDLMMIILDDNPKDNLITIELLPAEYEGYLCFDGVDDYAKCNGLPLLEDYTLICKRIWLGTDNNTTAKSIASKRANSGVIDGAFILERIGIDGISKCCNYGGMTGIEISQQDVVYQTASSYNGHYALKRGTQTDTELLSLGSVRPGYEFAQCAIAYFALYNRTLTTQEIEKEKVKLETEWNKRLIK